MSKNLKKKALAFGSMFGLVVSGIASIPASAANSEVEINPTSGTNWGVFYDDIFEVTASINRTADLYSVDEEDAGVSLLTPSTTLEITGIKGEEISFEGYISDADSQALFRATFNEFEALETAGGWQGYVAPVTAIAYDANGVEIGDYDLTDWEGDGGLDMEWIPADETNPGSFDGWYYVESSDFDFNVGKDEQDISRIVISGIPEFDREFDYEIELDEYAGAGSLDADAVEFGDGDITLATRVWIETSGNSKTVDTAFASASETITFYDPKGTIVTPRIERFYDGDNEDSALLDSLDQIGFSLQFSKKVNLNQIDYDDWQLQLIEEGTVIDEEDFDSGSTEVAFYWNAIAEEAGEYNLDVENRVYGLWWDNPILQSKSLRITAKYDNDPFTVEYGDEKARTYTSTAYKMSKGSDEVTDIVVTAVSSGNVLQEEDAEVAAVRAGTKSVVYTAQLYTEDDGETVELEKAGIPVVVDIYLGSDSFDDEANSITVNGQVVNNDRSELYVTGFTNAAGQFSVTVVSSAAAEDEYYDVWFQSLDAMSETSVYDYLSDYFNDADQEELMLDIADRADFEGWYLAADDDDYIVFKEDGDFYILDSDDSEDPIDEADYVLRSFSVSDFYRYGNEDGVTATYEEAVVDALEVDNELVASAQVALEYTVVDQFGEPISKYDGDALSVEILSTNSDDVEEYKAVGADGTVTLSFANYLKSPDTDVLTATVGVGLTSTTFEEIDGATGVTTALYSPINVASIIVDKTLATYVSYGDFITGKASATNIAPAADDAVELSGTVAGADNGGLPGAPVVIKGTGLQFFNGSTYSIGEATVIADVDGNFSVDVWTHSANAKGQAVTVTAGTKTETVTLSSALPTTLTGSELSFGWTLPAQIVKNTTYAVTLKLTDKWGNPLNTALSTDDRAVDVTASGSLEVNGGETVSRNFGADGTAVVYIRSVKDVAGPGTLEAALDADAFYATVDADGDAAEGNLDSLGTQTQDATTVWDETKWSSQLETVVQVLDAPTGKVNVGSFNGKLVVYASGLQGSTISWKVGGVWGKAVATSNYSVFDRPTPRRGVTVTVDIYVNGVKQLTKSVVTR